MRTHFFKLHFFVPLIFIFIPILSNGQGVKYAFFSPSGKKSIKIELRLKPEYLRDSGVVSLKPAIYIHNPQVIEEVKKPQNGSLSITMPIDGPAYLNFSGLLRIKKCGYYLTEPGDEVVITYHDGGFSFSGPGSEKYQLQYELDSVIRAIPKPSNPKDYVTKSKEDYFEYVKFLRNEFSSSVALLNGYKGEISEYIYETINTLVLKDLINRLRTKFYTLREYTIKKKEPVENMVHIYDTCFSMIVKEWLGQAVKKDIVELPLRSTKLDRVFAFDTSRMMSNEEKSLLLWRDVMKVYSGWEREKVIVNNFPKQLMNDVGFTPEVEKVLADYYAEPDFPEWKKWMKLQELEVRKKQMANMAPSFKLIDNKGKVYVREDFKGKYVMLLFWQSGSAEESGVVNFLKSIKNKYKDHSELILVNVSVDTSQSQWHNTIEKYRMSGIHLSTSEEGVHHDVIRRYAVTQFPTVWIIDPNGRVMNADPEVNFIDDKGKALNDFLARHLIAIRKDGPYVLYENKSKIAYSFKDSLILKKDIPLGKTAYLPVQTDLDQSFSLKLQATLANQPSEYSSPDKLLALSDIEGNFDAFRKLLSANGIIDRHFNWTFGKGHLVFAGDMFDRGAQVTECLWLLYSLEEKAKAAGGYVHFVLGNHEIMNLKGDHRYVQKKYKDNARRMNKTLAELYGEDSELGRWLRTKNIMEKVGDLLFVHGGISLPVLRMPLSISEINELVRPYYSKTIDSSNQYLVTLYGNKRVGVERSYTSPFWFRGYYGDSDNPREIPTMEQLDSTLHKFGVSHIVTGHTLIADTISVKYGGKIINTDTHHAEQESEALLVEGNRYYRVNAKGQKVLLFIDNIKNAGKESAVANTTMIKDFR